MTETHEQFWSQRRVFVLGCTGFLGSWVTRKLLSAGAEVVGLVHEAEPESPFFRQKLYQHAHVARGRADDRSRLRQLLAVYESDFVFQCAALPGGQSDLFTKALLPALLPSTLAILPSPWHLRAVSTNRSLITVQVPKLFGSGDTKTEEPLTAFFRAAADGDPLPMLEGGPFLHVADAAQGLLDCAMLAPQHPTQLLPQATVADLRALARGEEPSSLRLHPPEDAWTGARPLAIAFEEALQWYGTSASIETEARTLKAA
ncbi:MAG: NAD-dependent epimerase/dehydratase family protein [Gemmataceae bacterium]